MGRKILKILVLIFVLIGVFSIVMTILLSLFSYYKYPQVLPSKLNFSFWKNIISSNTLFKTSILSSLLLGTLNGIFVTMIGFMTGKGIVENKLHRSGKIMIFYTLPLFIPSTALFISIHSIMIGLRLNNTLGGVLLAQSLIAIPYSTNIAISFFEGFSRDIVLIAKTLGARKKDIFKRIYIRVMLPSLSLSFGICFVLSMSEYFGTFLIGGGQIITISTLYYPYINNADYGNSAVLSVIFMGINILVFAITEHFAKKLKHKNYVMFE